MDSFFLAEMFKYLYLLFTEKSELPIDMDDYIFTTEAHLLPVSLSTTRRPHQSRSSSSSGSISSSVSSSSSNNTVRSSFRRPPTVICIESATC